MIKIIVTVYYHLYFIVWRKFVFLFVYLFSDRPNNSSTETTVIIGGVIGIFILLTLFSLIGWIFCIKIRKRSREGWYLPG